MVVQSAIAGAERCLVIGTDHAAEALIGFFTKFGDGAADVLPLSGLNKRRGSGREMPESYAEPVAATNFSFDEAPKAVLRRLRMRRAAELLAKNALSIGFMGLQIIHAATGRRPIQRDFGMHSLCALFAARAPADFAVQRDVEDSHHRAGTRNKGTPQRGSLAG